MISTLTACRATRCSGGLSDAFPLYTDSAEELSWLIAGEPLVRELSVNSLGQRRLFVMGGDRSRRTWFGDRSDYLEYGQHLDQRR